MKAINHTFAFDLVQANPLALLVSDRVISKILWSIQQCCHVVRPAELELGLITAACDLHTKANGFRNLVLSAHWWHDVDGLGKVGTDFHGTGCPRFPVKVHVQLHLSMYCRSNTSLLEKAPQKLPLLKSHFLATCALSLLPSNGIIGAPPIL